MGKWSGLGQPNTRRKLHRWRAAKDLERKALEGALRSDEQHRGYSWNKRVRGAIMNPARWEELWG